MMDSTVAARRSLITVQRQSIEILRSLEGLEKQILNPNINWEHVMDKFGVLQAKIQSVFRQLSVGKALNLDEMVVTPWVLPGFDSNAQSHFGFNIDAVPDLLRTKLTPELEKEEQALRKEGQQAQDRMEATETSAGSGSDDDLDIQDVMDQIDRISSQLAEKFSEKAKEWSAQTNHRFWFPPGPPVMHKSYTTRLSKMIDEGQGLK
eukprot:m.14779 g.14779  ORF g.14779 m.14779 type:complete len:206 (+) comp5201_c0_seq2:164-781(+)